jgi:hypothetical protein
MKLKRATVENAFQEYADMYGWAKHLEDPVRLNNAIDGFHRELSKDFSEENFGAGLYIAMRQARGPQLRLPDFHRGFDAPDKRITMEELEARR